MSPPAQPARAPLALTGFELLSAVGDDAVQTCAAVRAKVSRVAEYPAYYPTGSDPGWNDDEPLMAAQVRGLPPGLPLRERMVELAARLLRRLPARFGLSRARLGHTALLVALPLPDAAVADADIPDQLVPELLRTCALPPFAATRALAGGHTAVFQLLDEGARIVAERTAESVLLVAVDSYLSHGRLQLLDEGWRLRSARNVDGFLPGEGAAALLLEPMRGRTAPPGTHAVLHPVALATEANPSTSEEHSTGRGLTAALAEALAASPVRAPYPWVICDMNGESYRAYEWGLAMTLLPDRLGSITRLSHPAECTGDVGAVSGALLIGLAACGFARGYAPAPEALLWAASDGNTRAALRIEAAPAAISKGET